MLSPNDIIDMPSRVTDMNPNGLINYLQNSGLEVNPLGQQAGILGSSSAEMKAYERKKNR